MSSATEISPGSTEATALQDAIQQDLIARGYSVEGDEVMAEFVFVMLCNHKKADQINGELADLIGPDFDPSFTVWLFQAVKRFFPRSKQAHEAAPAPASASTATEATVPPPDVPMDTSPSDFAYAQQPNVPPQRGSQRGGPRGSDPFGLYNKAISGVKRPRDFGEHRDDRGNQRQRLDGPPSHAPTGPKHPQPTDGLASAGPPKRGGGGGDQRSLFDRVGPPPGTIPVMSPMGPALYNPQSGSFMPTNGGGGRRGGNYDQQQQQPVFTPGAVPLFIPPGMVPQFPQGGLFPPQMFAQLQQFQQAQAQGAANGQPPVAMNGFPGFAAGAPARPPQEVPTKPSDEGLCRFATECKNAYCKFAHPSPAASKESGLVLSDEPCEKQLECEDADCPKSHISPQAKDPANSRAPPAHESAGLPRPPRRQQPSFQSSAPSGKPCKFGAACTRHDCMFIHPWDKPVAPCRFGSSCTRPDCHFSHPPGHNPYRPRTFGPPKGGNRTAVFNTPSSASVGDKLAATEAEKAALSDRMKKFAAGEGETEKIIPGQPEQAAPAPAAAAADSAPKIENGQSTAMEVDSADPVKKEES